MKKDWIAQAGLAAIGVSMMVAWAVNRDEANSPHHPIDYYMGEPLAVDMTTQKTEPETTAEETIPPATIDRYAWLEYEATEALYEPETTELPTEPQTTATEPADEPSETIEDQQGGEWTYSENEILLMRVASCEAGNQGIEGMALVMRVVLNRLQDPRFPKTISEIIYQEEQFGCIQGAYWQNEYLAPGCGEALALIYQGWDESQGALAFCTPQHNAWHRSHIQYIFTYKNHEFYRW